MGKKSIRITMLIVIGIVLVGSITSCDLETVGENSRTVADVTGNLAPHVPQPLGLILYGISGVAATVSGVAFGWLKYQEAKKMRKAIRATSKAIGSAKNSTNVELNKAARLTTGYIGALREADNPGLAEDLDFFDAVRKGYK